MTQQTPQITDILQERGSRYGKFSDLSEISQGLKDHLKDNYPEAFKRMKADQKEAIELMIHKLSRVINGDPDYSDSWRDIGGYAILVADRLDGKAQ